jgi:hypothetical protein
MSASSRRVKLHAHVSLISLIVFFGPFLPDADRHASTKVLPCSGRKRPVLAAATHAAAFWTQVIQVIQHGLAILIAKRTSIHDSLDLTFGFIESSQSLEGPPGIVLHLLQVVQTVLKLFDLALRGLTEHDGSEDILTQFLSGIRRIR